MPKAQTYLGRALLGPTPAQPASYAFGGFDENAKGYPVPMRGVISHDWGYVFNAWADGEHTIKVADMNHLSFKQMQRHASKDPAIKARLDYFLERATEELCHLKVDPDCLVNLADDPAYAGVLAEMQAAMREQMVRTDDYLLEAFDARGDREELQAFMRRRHDTAMERAKRLRWKRSENIAGGTGKNRDLLRQ
jgi:N-sulfoglucosamine sulfohydrolase